MEGEKDAKGDSAKGMSPDARVVGTRTEEESEEEEADMVEKVEVDVEVDNGEEDAGKETGHDTYEGR